MNSDGRKMFHAIEIPCNCNSHFGYKSNMKYTTSFIKGVRKELINIQNIQKEYDNSTKIKVKIEAICIIETWNKKLETRGYC